MPIKRCTVAPAARIGSGLDSNSLREAGSVANRETEPRRNSGRRSLDCDCDSEEPRNEGNLPEDVVLQ